MQTLQEIQAAPVKVKTAKQVRRSVPAPGRIVNFEEALKITLKEDSELLRRLAQ